MIAAGEGQDDLESVNRLQSLFPPPAAWKAIVNRPQREAEKKAVRHSVQRGNPLRRRAMDRRHGRPPEP